MPPDIQIVFYEDRPYCFLPYNLQLRLMEIAAAVPGPEGAEILAFDRSVALRAFAEGLQTVTMYKNVLTSKRQRFRYLLSAARKLKAPAKDPTLNLTAHIISTRKDNDLNKIHAAISSYKSQIPMLFKNMDTLTRESESYNRTLDASARYCERYWVKVR
jgi:hypothetical protein